MSTRLQVLLEAREYRSLQEAAKAAGLSLGEWVRQALRRAMTLTAKKPARTKLTAIRRASRHRFPTADIDDMLEEIERGYTS